MKIIRGDLWDAENYDVVAVTTNSIIKSGKLIMGCGTALQAKRKYPDIDVAAAQAISCDPHPSDYGWLVITTAEGVQVGLFQSKRNYRHPSSLSILITSFNRLTAYLSDTDAKVAMPVPGVGAGGLPLEAVKRLWDTTYRYRFEDKVDFYQR